MSLLHEHTAESFEYSFSLSSKAALREKLERDINTFLQCGGEILPAENSSSKEITSGTWVKKASVDEIQANINRSAERDKTIRSAGHHLKNKSATKNETVVNKAPKSKTRRTKQSHQDKIFKQKLRRRNVSHDVNTAEGREKKAEYERKQKVLSARLEAQEKGEMYFTAPCRKHGETTFRYFKSITRCMLCIKKKKTDVDSRKAAVQSENRNKMQAAIAEHEQHCKTGYIHFLGECLRCGPNVTLRVRYKSAGKNISVSYYCIGCQAKASRDSGQKRLTRQKNLTQEILNANTTLMKLAIDNHKKDTPSKAISFLGHCQHCGSNSRFTVNLGSANCIESATFHCNSCHSTNKEKCEKLEDKIRKEKISLARKEAQAAGLIYFIAPCKYHQDTIYYTTAYTARCVACSKNEPTSGVIKVSVDENHNRLKKNRMLMAEAIKLHSDNRESGPIIFIGNCGTCGDGAKLKVNFKKIKSGLKPYYLCVECSRIATQKCRLRVTTIN